MNFLLAATALGSWVDATFYNFDIACFGFFENIRSGIANFIAMLFTSLGDEIFVILFAVMGLVLIMFKRTRKYGFAIVFAIIIGTLVTNVVLKPMFMRVRPYNTLQGVDKIMDWYRSSGMLSESDFCFPSGHTTGATEIGVVLCMLHWNSKKKGIAWIFPLIAVIVGFSRVYLVVHYATDVIASFVIGIIAAILGYYLAKLVCLILRKTGVNEKWDFEKIHIRRKGRRYSKGSAFLAIATATIIIFLISFIRLAAEVNFFKPGYETDTSIERCSYDAEYKCYNEAKTGSKYPAIEGKYYCKIHWKELNE